MTHLEAIKAEETLFLTEIGGQIIRGEEKEVLERARSAGLGRVYGIHYLKPVEGNPRVTVHEYSPTLDSDYPWCVDIFGVPSYVVEGIVELVSKYREPKHK